MNETELLALRSVLVERRRLLISRLATDAAEETFIEPAVLHLLVDIQTVIAAIDAVLAELEGGAR